MLQGGCALNGEMSPFPCYSRGFASLKARNEGSYSVKVVDPAIMSDFAIALGGLCHTLRSEHDINIIGDEIGHFEVDQLVGCLG